MSSEGYDEKTNNGCKPLPSCIPMCVSSPAPEEVADSKIKASLDDPKEALTFMQEIRESLSQEYNCMEMQPSRVKPENKIHLKQGNKKLAGTKRTRKVAASQQLQLGSTQQSSYKRAKVFDTPERSAENGYFQSSGSGLTRVSSSEITMKKEHEDNFIPTSPKETAYDFTKGPTMDSEDHHGFSSGLHSGPKKMGLANFKM